MTAVSEERGGETSASFLDTVLDLDAAIALPIMVGVVAIASAFLIVAT